VRPEQRVTLLGRAIGKSFLRNAAAQDLGVVGFTHDYLGVRAFRLQRAGYPFERSAGTESGYPVIEFLIAKCLENLGRCRSSVCVGIRFVLKLAHKEPAVLVGEFRRFRQHAAAFELSGCKDNLGTEESHHTAAFDAEALCHRHDQRVAFMGTDDGQADTRIARCGLNHGLAGFERAVTLGGLDDG